MAVFMVYRIQSFVKVKNNILIDIIYIYIRDRSSITINDLLAPGKVMCQQIFKIVNLPKWPNPKYNWDLLILGTR